MGMWVGVLGNWKRNRKEGHLRINQNSDVSIRTGGHVAGGGS